MKSFYLIPLLVLLIFGLFLFIISVSAQWDDWWDDWGNGWNGEDNGEENGEEEEEEEEEEPCYPCPGFDHYECTSDCDGELLEIWCDQCDCGGGCWTAASVSGDPWQKCDAGIGSFYCDGGCLEDPQNPRYYDDPTFSDRSDKDVGNTNIKLPVKLDWDDVPGWKNEGGCGFNCSGNPLGPQSYVVEIKETTKGDYSTTTNESEYNYREDPGAGACLLKSNSSHNWDAKTCCTADGQNCGPENNWSFATNIAPEPVSPYDPDWTGLGYAEPNWDESEIFPVHLDWCDVEEANSYYIKNYRYAPGEEEKIDRTGEDYYLPVFAPIIITGKTTRKSPFVLKSENWFFLEEFTKGILYDWQIAACLNEDGTQCGLACPADAKWDDPCTQLSQKWSFFGHLELFPPEIIFPKGQTINMLDSLQWIRAAGADSSRYFLWGSFVYPDGTPFGGGIVAVSVPEDVVEVPFEDIWTDFFADNLQLKLDTYFKWWVQSCWSRAWEEPNCQEEGVIEYDFWTTGAPPANLIADNTIIPVKLDWDDMPGAASYYYEVATDEEFDDIVVPQDQRVVLSPEVPVGYPSLKQDTEYWWRVKTCADREGEVCGNWSDGGSFPTFTLAEPTPSRPKEGEEFYTYERYLRWDEVAGARAYQYRVYYGTVEKIPLTKVFTNYALIDTPRQLEVGGHSWEVHACVDENCEEVGPPGGPWPFEVVAKIPPGATGVVPCGRNVNVPDPYDIDETEPCGFQHIFLLLRNILDLVLWRIGLIILVLLALYSGIIFYFSGQLGVPDPLLQVKSLWKAAGMGYLIVFLSYIVVNIFLGILGYKIGVFGPWWQISF